MKTEWEYVLQRCAMRESFGHYSPDGDWEDVEVYKSWKRAMRHFTKTSHAMNRTYCITYIFRVLTRKIKNNS